LILPTGNTSILTRAGAVGEKESIAMTASGKFFECNTIHHLLLRSETSSIEKYSVEDCHSLRQRDASAAHVMSHREANGQGV
jgi:hypothetical protein